MRIFLFLLLAVPGLTIAQPAPKPKVTGFILKGKLEGYAAGTEIKLIKNGENIEAAKATLKNGEFLLKGKVEEPDLYFLVIADNSPVELFLENANITFKANKGKPEEFKVEGSASHRDFTQFLSAFMPIAKQLSALANTINNTMEGPDRESLMKTYTTTQANLQKEIDKFIAAKTASPVSPFVLNATYQFNEDPVQLEKRYNMLQAKIKASASGKQLEAFIAESKIGAIGTQSIDFTQPDTTGSLVSLSSFRGKYVLIDFWASWCAPCRMENPNVVESFQKFNKKNFTVLGVSLDRPGQRDKWIDAIRADNLSWTHVSDLQFWSNAAAQLYHVKGIPQNFLVDPEGKIIAKNLRGAALEAKLCEVLGCN